MRYPALRVKDGRYRRRSGGEAVSASVTACPRRHGQLPGGGGGGDDDDEEEEGGGERPAAGPAPALPAAAALPTG